MITVFSRRVSGFLDCGYALYAAAAISSRLHFDWPGVQFRYRRLDSDRPRPEFSWEPSVPLDRGLERTVHAATDAPHA